jgi:hypothetical protein
MAPEAGETMELYNEGGADPHVWITMAGEVYHLKKVVLRMYWDGEAEPSRDADRDFRPGAWTYAAFHSDLLAPR